MRDEAFPKKKASCGNYPRTFIFFTKADALSLQCPAVPVTQHNFGRLPQRLDLFSYLDKRRSLAPRHFFDRQKGFAALFLFLQKPAHQYKIIGQPLFRHPLYFLFQVFLNRQPHIAAYRFY